MGNWRTVWITGTCDNSEVQALAKHLDCTDVVNGDDDSDEAYERVTPLSHAGGLCGLGAWAAESINAVGNLFERDYSVGDVAAALVLLGGVAPSLSVKIHCGGEYESKECVATISLDQGKTESGRPEIKTLPKLSQDAMAGRLLKALQRKPC